jgi:hypothetical protein
MNRYQRRRAKAEARKKKRSLPVTAEEAQMVSATMAQVAKVYDKLSDNRGAFLEAILRESLLRDLIDRIKVIEAADNDDVIADAALGYVFHSMMDRGEQPPASITAYEARRRMRGPITRGRGSHTWYENYRRDAGVACLMYWARERFGLGYTRNPATSAPCAASVVAEALTQMAIEISEERARKIWGQQGAALVACMAERGS